jgi:hypothetical protein
MIEGAKTMIPSMVAPKKPSPAIRSLATLRYAVAPASKRTELNPAASERHQLGMVNQSTKCDDHVRV